MSWPIMCEWYLRLYQGLVLYKQSIIALCRHDRSFHYRMLLRFDAFLGIMEGIWKKWHSCCLTVFQLSRIFAVGHIVSHQDIHTHQTNKQQEDAHVYIYKCMLCSMSVSAREQDGITAMVRMCVFVCLCVCQTRDNS